MQKCTKSTNYTNVSVTSDQRPSFGTGSPGTNALPSIRAVAMWGSCAVPTTKAGCNLACVQTRTLALCLWVPCRTAFLYSHQRLLESDNAVCHRSTPGFRTSMSTALTSTADRDHPCRGNL